MHGGKVSSPTLDRENGEQISIRLLAAAQFKEAKRWWFWANVSRLLVIIVTVVSLLWKEWLGWIWVLPVILTVILSLLQWRADILQGKAEALKRKLEFQDGLGWKISEKEKADLILEVSNTVKKAGFGKEDLPYFDSRQEVSARRAVENLNQSAWYTKHLARKMSGFLFTLSAISLGLFVLTLVVFHSLPFQRWEATVGRILVTVVALLVAYGYLRIGFQYRSLSSQAERANESASRLLELETLTEIQAIRILHEYQIARAIAPLIPDWLWRRNKTELNNLWEQQKSQ